MIWNEKVAEMVGYTREDDACAAEAIGYVWTKTQAGFSDGKFRKWLRYLVPNAESAYYHHDDDGEGYVDPPSSYQYVPPFLSAPTWETDGIVLEWVQGSSIMNLFKNALVGLFPVGDDYVDMPNIHLNLFIQFYKPGMYAQALLEALLGDG